MHEKEQECSTIYVWKSLTPKLLTWLLPQKTCCTKLPPLFMPHWGWTYHQMFYMYQDILRLSAVKLKDLTWQRDKCPIKKGLDSKIKKWSRCQIWAGWDQNLKEDTEFLNLSNRTMSKVASGLLGKTVELHNSHKVFLIWHWTLYANTQQ